MREADLVGHHQRNREATASLNSQLGKGGKRFHLPAPILYRSRVDFMELQLPYALGQMADG